MNDSDAGNAESTFENEHGKGSVRNTGQKSLREFISEYRIPDADDPRTKESGLMADYLLDDYGCPCAMVIAAYHPKSHLLHLFFDAMCEAGARAVYDALTKAIHNAKK